MESNQGKKKKCALVESKQGPPVQSGSVSRISRSLYFLRPINDLGGYINALPLQPITIWEKYIHEFE